VRAYLRDATGRMGSLLVRLRLRAAAGPPEDEHAALVRAFEDRLTLAELAEELRVAHQRLLSLYPAVDAALVEAVRQRHHGALRLTEAAALGAVLGPFLEGLANTLHALGAALVERP
jgi:hypothetical protein